MELIRKITSRFYNEKKKDERNIKIAPKSCKQRILRTFKSKFREIVAEFNETCKGTVIDIKISILYGIRFVGLNLYNLSFELAKMAETVYRLTYSVAYLKYNTYCLSKKQAQLLCFGVSAEIR